MTEQYYENPELWINGSFSLKDIIDDILVTAQDQDSLFKYASPYALGIIARAGLRDLQYSYKNSVRAIEFDVPSSLLMPFPEDYHSLIRASLSDGCGNLTEITQRSRIPAYAVAYLQSCKGELVFDCKGEVYELSSSLTCRHGNCVSECSECQKCHIECKDVHNDWISEQNGFFQFSPEIEGKSVFIEYASNGTEGLSDCAIRVKYGYEAALTSYIKWKYLIDRRNTQNQAVYYQQEYMREIQKLKKRTPGTNPTDINALIKVANMRFY
jgi:hypothetical protein